MSFWIILLLVGAALSPLAWLRPSRRESRQMNHRLAARGMGLGVQLSSESWPHWFVKEPPSRCPQYYRPRRRGNEDQWCYWQFAAGQWVNQWREPCADPRVLEQLIGLPEDVFKMEAGKQMLVACWGEGAQPLALEQIVAALDVLA
ncbi:MAG: hypothetical protein K2Y25_12705 [Pseudomonadaceae bacterium]|nr:hypothetical protein [Pseudomonadaceae bacterium]